MLRRDAAEVLGGLAALGLRLERRIDEGDWAAAVLA
jgi:hypothetical protein